jgi:hypothetical protein
VNRAGVAPVRLHDSWGAPACILSDASASMSLRLGIAPSAQSCCARLLQLREAPSRPESELRAVFFDIRAGAYARASLTAKREVARWDRQLLAKARVRSKSIAIWNRIVERCKGARPCPRPKCRNGFVTTPLRESPSAAQQRDWGCQASGMQGASIIRELRMWSAALN